MPREHTDTMPSNVFWYLAWLFDDVSCWHKFPRSCDGWSLMENPRHSWPFHVSRCLKGWPSNDIIHYQILCNTYTVVSWFDIGMVWWEKVTYRCGDTGRAYSWLSFTCTFTSSAFSMFIALHERVFIDIQRLLHKKRAIRHVQWPNLIMRFHQIWTSLMSNMT